MNRANAGSLSRGFGVPEPRPARPQRCLNRRDCTGRHDAEGEAVGGADADERARFAHAAGESYGPIAGVPLPAGRIGEAARS
jgi:hypothetical protein